MDKFKYCFSLSKTELKTDIKNMSSSESDDSERNCEELEPNDGFFDKFFDGDSEDKESHTDGNLIDKDLIEKTNILLNDIMSLEKPEWNEFYIEMRNRFKKAKKDPQKIYEMYGGMEDEDLKSWVDEQKKLLSWGRLDKKKVKHLAEFPGVFDTQINLLLEDALEVLSSEDELTDKYKENLLIVAASLQKSEDKSSLLDALIMYFGIELKIIDDSGFDIGPVSSKIQKVEKNELIRVAPELKTNSDFFTKIIEFLL